MKTTSIFSLLVLSTYAFVPAYCNPTPNCDVGQACANNIARDDNVALDAEAGLIAPTAAAAVKDISTDPKIKAKINKLPACFWSGYTVVKGKKVYAAAKEDEFKDLVGCNTIDDAVALVGQTKASKRWDRDTDWKAVSIAYASVITRDASVLLGQNITDDAIWPDEEKELKKNKITIIGYSLNDQGKIVEN